MNHDPLVTPGSIVPEAGRPHDPSGPRKVAALAGWVGISLAAGAIGGLASVRASAFYADLARPAWAPPSWLFGPVWTALYVLMGVAEWLVWRRRGWSGAALPLTLFVFQLVLNALWTWIFFAWRSGAFALVEIVALDIAVVVTAVLFWRISRAAGALLVPYILWVLYATALTAALWRANAGLL